MRFDPKTKLSEVYIHSDAGLRSARRRYRLQGRGLGVARQRPPRQLRSLQVQGSAQRPERDRRSLPRGLDVLQISGPGLCQGIGDNSAEASYYTWVDQHNAVGLGNDVPISTANQNDGFAALVDGKMVMLRIPYPMGFYAKGLDARIDDPNGRLEGQGLVVVGGRPHALAQGRRQGHRRRWPCTSRFGPIRWRIERSARTCQIDSRPAPTAPGGLLLPLRCCRYCRIGTFV